MQKIKISTQIPHVNAKLQHESYVVRSEVVGDAFVVRYFKVLPPDAEIKSVLQDVLTTFDPESTNLLRQMTDGDYFVGHAVTSDPKFSEHKMLEIGRHNFRPTIGSASVVGAGEKNDFSLYVLPFNGVDAIGEPYNHFVESAQVKGQVHRNGRMRGLKAVFMLYSDDADAPLSNWTIFYLDTSAFVLEDKIAGNWTTQEQFNSQSLLPSFQASAPSSVQANGSCTVGLTLKRNGNAIPYTGDVDVEVLSGYVPKRRIAVVNGLASINVMALGLTAGDNVRIKIGTRNVSGLADVTIPVV